MATEPHGEKPAGAPSPVIHVESVGTGTDSHGEFRLAGPSHDFSYEPDKFAVKTILAVPAAVLFTGIFAFVLTYLLFDFIFDPKIQEKPEDPEAAKRNAAPINDRFARTSSTDPNAEFKQPRLEGLQQTETHDRDGYTLNAEMTTTRPKKEGNPPRYHADDLRPERIPELSTPGKDPVTGATRIPVDEAIAQLIRGDHLKAREGAAPLDIHANPDRPKESNGGTGKRPEGAPAPKKKEPEGKKDDAKKDDAKKDDAKKE
jgi:hypothetical protein